MIDYHIDTDRQLITTRGAGRITLADFAGHLQRILRDRKFNQAFNSLIIALDATAVPSPTTIQLLKPLVRAWSFRRSGVKWAIVLPDATSRALVEAALLEINLTNITARCFLSEGAAISWLELLAAARSA
jgi:hypothetical protein